MLGHHPHSCEMPFKWCFGGGPMMASLKWYFDPPSPHQLKQKNNKKYVKVGPPLTKLSGSAHVLVWPADNLCKQFGLGSGPTKHRA